MKRHHLLIILFVSISAITCKKEENWSQKLQNTAWAAEYNSGSTTPTQAMSIVFNNDSTLLVFAYFLEFPGTWSVNKNIVTIKTSNNIITAKLGKDRWSNFSSTNPNINVTNVEKSFVPNNLTGQEWTGKRGTKDIVIKFETGGKVNFFESGAMTSSVSATYFLKAGAIAFNVPYPGTLYGVGYIGCFYNNGATFKGYASDPYSTYAGNFSTTKK